MKFIYKSDGQNSTLCYSHVLAPDGSLVDIGGDANSLQILQTLPQVLSIPEALALQEKTGSIVVMQQQTTTPQNNTKMQMYNLDSASGKIVARTDNNNAQVVRVETQGTLTGGTPLSITLDATLLDAGTIYGVQIGGGTLAARLLSISPSAIVIGGTQGTDTVAVINQAVIGNGFTTVDVQITVAGTGGNVVFGQDKVVEQFQLQNSITSTSVLRQTIDVTLNRNESTLNNNIINLPNERFKFSLLEGMVLWIQGGQKYTAKMKIFSDSAQVGVFQKLV